LIEGSHGSAVGTGAAVLEGVARRGKTNQVVRRQEIFKAEDEIIEKRDRLIGQLMALASEVHDGQ